MKSTEMSTEKGNKPTSERNGSDELFIRNGKRKSSFSCTKVDKPCSSNEKVPSDHETKNENLEINGQKIINLSSRVLTHNEIQILGKGLKFCPTQLVTDAGESRKDLDDFHKRLRTKQFFEKSNLSRNGKTTQLKSKPLTGKMSPYGNCTDFLKLKRKSTWRPPTGSANLETFISVNEMELGKSHHPRNPKQNITTGERQAIKTLSNNKEIVIKPADKGGAIVVQNTSDYIIEAERQLGDIKTYLKLQNDPTARYEQEVSEKLSEMVEKGEITEKVKKILTNDKPKTPNIYFLPKIHKEQRPPPGRPIVSANECPTEKNFSLCRSLLEPLRESTEIICQRHH